MKFFVSGPCGSGLFEEQPGTTGGLRHAQMANWLTFALGAMLRTEGCDISQEDVSAHTALARLGETNFHTPTLHPLVHFHQHPHHTTVKDDEPCNSSNNM